MRIALIDGDEIAYKIASSYEDKNYGVVRDDLLLYKFKKKQDAIEAIGDDNSLDIKVIKEFRDLSTLENDIRESVNNIISKTFSGDFRVCLSTEYNFRTDLATLLPYKGNRVSEDRVEYFDLVRETIKKTSSINKVRFWYGLEADDLLSFLQYNYKPSSFETIICSTDKDLRTVPGLNYNIKTGEIKDISEEEARYNFYYQLLIGDAVDNIPSPYGLGPVKAKEILRGIEDKNDLNYYQKIKETYEEYLNKKDKNGEYKTKWYSGQDIDSILYEIGNLLYMHRTLDLSERWIPVK